MGAFTWDWFECVLYGYANFTSYDISWNIYLHLIAATDRWTVIVVVDSKIYQQQVLQLSVVGSLKSRSSTKLSSPCHETPIMRSYHYLPTGCSLVMIDIIWKRNWQKASQHGIMVALSIMFDSWLLHLTQVMIMGSCYRFL